MSEKRVREIVVQEVKSNPNAKGPKGETGAQGPAGAGGVTTAGTNIAITGSGTTGDPYVVNNSTIRVGDALAGGTVFYVDNTGQSGLIVANNDEVGTHEYDTLAGDTPAASDNYDGATNSVALIALGGGRPEAADACAARGAGWFLPSFFQLSQLFSKPFVVPNLVGNAGYWSSTQSFAGNAYQCNISAGCTSTFQNSNARVRCIRAF